MSGLCGYHLSLATATGPPGTFRPTASCVSGSCCTASAPPADAPMLIELLAIVASGQSFACTPTAVWDGDGPIWCAEGPKIRLAGIAAREIDGTCKKGHPCPA